jgi:PAS domain S-box-containing protein
MTAAKILIVEDDRVVARDISQQLERLGHSVVGVTALGEQALPLTLETSPDLVLMDIRLDGAVDGIDAAEQIRRECHRPIVFLTAYSDEETVKRATSTEPFGYLLKPFEDAQLRTTIEMALYKHAAEQKLRASERRFAATLSSIGDAVIATDAQGRVTFMNPVAEALTGWPRQEAAGRPLPDVFCIVNEDTREIVEDPGAKVLRLGAVIGLANHTALLARDGRERPIDDCGSPIIDESGGIIGAVIVFRDVSERRQIQEALRKTQAELTRVSRLITMGQLTALIAQEVKQPITAAVTYASAARRWLSAEPPNFREVDDALSLIVKEGNRAGEIVARIPTLIKKVPTRKDAVAFNDAILEVIALTRAEAANHGVSVRTQLAEGLPRVRGDRLQLQQVLLNLIINAIEAMRDVGEEERELLISSRKEPDGVSVEVRDSGPGFAPGTLDRVFEAYYTTKPGDLGMGLSICRSIIEAHGGRLWASANLPRGASFQFALPAIANTAS